MLKNIFIVFYTDVYCQIKHTYIEEIFDTEAAAEDYVSQQFIPEDYEIEEFYMHCGRDRNE